jgi:hypothetical protein
MKSLISIVAGIIVGVVVLSVVEGSGNMVLSSMLGIEAISAQGAAALLTVRPSASLAVVVVAYLVGPFMGGFTAASLAPDRLPAHAAAVGTVQFVFGLIALSLFPHPVWFWLATFVTIVPAALAGANVARWNVRRRKDLLKSKPRR